MISKTEIVKYDTISPRQVFKHYQLSVLRTSKPIKPIVFIHGGAWRDPTNTYEDYDKLINYLDTLLSSPKGNNSNDIMIVDMFSIDYRLSPEFKHPDHLIDTLNALELIQKKFKVNDGVSVVGHSVGSTLITQLLDYKLILNSFGIAKELSIPEISSVVFLEGIYDISDMLDEYPAYSFFVDEAFKTKEDSLYRCSFVQLKLLENDQRIKHRKKFEDFEKVIIVHSTKDELLSSRQPTHFRSWLVDSLGYSGENMTYIYEDFGVHNDVYEHPKVAEILVKGLCI